MLEKYKDEEVSISICGYSFGVVFVIFNVMDIVVNGYNWLKSCFGKFCFVMVFVFVSFCVGNFEYKKFFFGYVCLIYLYFII